MCLVQCYLQFFQDHVGRTCSISTDFGLIEVSFDGQIFGFIETETAHHKTATSLKKKMRFMPIVCPILGITSTDWTEQWFGTFAELQVDMASCPFGPICRAPGLDGVLGVRSCTSDEISSFINRVLNTGDSEKLTSHSLKHTTRGHRRTALMNQHGLCWEITRWKVHNPWRCTQEICSRVHFNFTAAC